MRILGLSLPRAVPAILFDTMSVSESASVESTHGVQAAKYDRKRKRAFPSSWRGGKREPTEILSHDEIARILRQCSKTSGYGMRNRALITTMWRGGLRVAEALALELHDIDMAQCVLHIRHGKGNRRRYVPMDEAAFAVIQQWLAMRSRFPGITGSFVFCTRTGGQIATIYCRQMFPRLALKAGIDKRLHCHALRHTCAYDMHHEGVPILFIQKILGHGSLRTTEIYVNHMVTPDLIARVKARALPLAAASVLL